MPEGLKLSVLVPVYNERFLAAESIRRVLAVRHPSIREVEVIVVDDGSTDGTREVLRALAREHPALRYIEHERNQGKGAALRTALAHATGDVCVPHDADLEYHPDDFGALVQPFLKEQADAVFGSRFLPGEYRRVLLFYHSVGNRLLTTLVNLLTNLNLSDMETCYKMVRTKLLRSIPLRYNDFRIEPELTIKLAKRGAAIFEAPIRYSGRTYAEGKKIGWRDGLKALGAIVRGALVDDLYVNDPYGAHILHSLSRARKFSRWMSDAIRPWVGRSVLEIGAGIGNLTVHLVPRDRYRATDINPDYLDYLAISRWASRTSRSARCTPSPPRTSPRSPAGSTRSSASTCSSISTSRCACWRTSTARSRPAGGRSCWSPPVRRGSTHSTARSATGCATRRNGCGRS